MTPALEDPPPPPQPQSQSQSPPQSQEEEEQQQQSEVVPQSESEQSESQSQVADVSAEPPPLLTQSESSDEPSSLPQPQLTDGGDDQLISQIQQLQSEAEANVNGSENDVEDDDEEDDEEDDIKITIGDIAATPPYSGGAYAPINFNISKRGPAFGPGGQVTSNSGAKSKNAGLNVDAVATYQNTPIYELNLELLEDKPWRKPGADITDYFNYGFTEETWKIYCEKQKRIQHELAGGSNNNEEMMNISNDERRSNDKHSNGNQPPVITSHSTPGPKANAGPPSANLESPIPVASVNENSKYSGIGLTKKAGPPPGRKPSGTIDVIGGGTPSTPSVITSRRPPDPSDTSFNQMMAPVPPGPGIPPSPFHYPPPPFGIPPPHAGIDFLPPHPMGPRGLNPPVIGVQPSTSYPPPHMVDYGMMLPIKRERDDDRDDRERREKDDREREERDKREREERERRDKRRERDDRDKRDRRDREKHIKKERRDDRDRDRDDRDKRERRSDRDKSERRHRDDRDEHDRHESKKRKKSESESKDKEDREKRERREREEKEKRER